MKNTIFIIAAGLFTSSFYNVVSAQKIETISTASVTRLHKNSVEQQLLRNQIPSKAYRHFMRNFAGPKNEVWQLNAKGSTAMFYVEGMQQFVFYGRSGNWMSTVRNYNESKLPQSTFRLIKSLYCDYTITHCSEVQNGAGSVFYITILKNNDYKILKVRDEEIEIKNEFTYSNGNSETQVLSKQ